ncbi:MAG: hypothetical protein ACRC9V_10480 [Aeromonas sp.]
MSSIFESVVAQNRARASFGGLREPAGNEVSEKAFFESVSDKALLEAADKADNQVMRAYAMALAIEFVNDGDDTADALDAYAQGMADADEDGEIGEPEQEDYEESLSLLGDALVALGVPAKIAASAMEGDDAAAAKAYAIAVEMIDSEDFDEDETISNFSVRETLIAEATKKVIRGGEVKLIKKRLVKKKMSSAQRQGLKKARMKSHSSGAKRARAKSMKIRKSRGM